ncbi:MAG: hypothetical protein GY913_18330 [Proteobacteria bacterium]|nr:hypothetical protein [Pseudomonadota bacterium]MCP4918867.1 hypothetical protein [Pseudomonadota bacterium]
MTPRKLAIAGLLLAGIGGGVAWWMSTQEPEPEPEPEVAQPMSDKEQIELMMRIGYIQQEDLDEIPDEPAPE